MSAFSKNGKNKKPESQPQGQSQMLNETPEAILLRRKAIENSVGDKLTGVSIPGSTAGADTTLSHGRVGEGLEEVSEPTGMAAEKAVGALCYLPKSIHRLATRFAEDRDLTAKRFFLETMLLGLEQQGVITSEQRLEALTLPNEYGWKGRKQ